VIIVDDHAVVRAGLAQFLGQTDDLQVCGQAATSAEAETLCETLQPDILVTDMLLGETTALESIRRIRAAHPALRIIVLSMYSDELYAKAARDAGADAYVMKHSSPGELLATLRPATFAPAQ
jgi:DNA-binding NarL/FixJ family response regulator